MRIIIKWLPQAIALLDNIYRFYSEKSHTADIRLYNRLLDSAEPLRVFPRVAPDGRADRFVACGHLAARPAAEGVRQTDDRICAHRRRGD